MEEIKEEIKKYKDVCKECGKEIIGNSKKQVLWNMELHVKQKHS